MGQRISVLRAVRPAAYKQLRTTFVMGTRPEAIKLAPVILGAQVDNRFNTNVVTTGQHGKMLDQALSVFEIEADQAFSVLRKGQSLCQLTSRIVTGIGNILESNTTDVLVVHGDTTTAMASALAASFQKIPVAHIEAGLRAYGAFCPFPEEKNRKVISQIADFHLAPTTTAVQNLVREGVQMSDIVCTGNTVIDALVIASKNNAISKSITDLPRDKRIILVTAHRRENIGEPLKNICSAVAKIARQHKDVLVVWPMHKNPQVREIVKKHLEGVANVLLLEPLDYISFVQLMKRSYLILTDSGGIQEEAPALGKPVLIMRGSTERPEGIACKATKIVGTTVESILQETENLLGDEQAYQQMITTSAPYGDGKSAQRILDALYERYKDKRNPHAPERVALFTPKQIKATVDALKAIRTKKQEESVGKSFSAVRNWLLNSGMQTRTGAVYSWYDADKGSYAYIYPEIMGYWMTAMCALAESEPLGENTDTYMTSARRAGDWILRRGFRDCGAVPSRFYEKRGTGNGDVFHSKHGLIATFDNGIILNGFLNLYEKTFDEKYLTAARTIAAFILDKMAPPGGRIQALYSFHENRYLEFNDRWSCSPGSFLAKVAIAMLHMHKVTGDASYSDCAVHLCSNALKYQEKDTGRFKLPDGSTYTHPHCYSAEGLLSAGTLLSREEFVSAGVAGTRWLLQQADKKGHVRRNYESTVPFPKAVSSDIQAQAIRLFFIAKEASPEIMHFAPASKKLLEFMLSYQNWDDEEDPKVYGGFRYGTSTEDGSDIDTYNSWASMFAMQALMFCRKGMTSYNPFMLI
ncbi:MAG: UDP-N-acetylglucosamine 2-epimerase (non-hydrolyzing) [Candidatus Margulisiibacteriota bacterium]